MERPRIVVTLTNPERAADRSVAELKNRRYLEAVERAGGTALPLDERAANAARAAGLAAMHGLVISGGADIDPARFGERVDGARAPDPGRDQLDEEAFRAARDLDVPVLGVCRGMQAINVFSGGSLLQDVEGHEGAPYPAPRPQQHPIQIAGGTRLAFILGGAESLAVNSYHHQAVTPDRLAPSLVSSASAAHQDIELIEGLEARDPDRWVVGIQCHPERTESSPLVLERLWTAFVAAARDRRSRAAVRDG